jgi:hypothetical protein
MNAERNKVFISYSHQDGKYLKRLQVHLKLLEREHQVCLWDDTRIAAGSDWRAEIQSELENASAAILLVSADFLASDFIMENELPPLLEASKSRGTIILPVIISPCRYTRIEGLSKFQAINDPSRPLSSLPVAERERIWVKLAENIEAAVKGREIEEGWEVALERQIIDKLTDLVSASHPDGTFLIIENGDFYVQFMHTKAEYDLFCEAVSNTYLPENAQLTQEDSDRLIAMGFTAPSEGFENYFREYFVDKYLSVLPEIALTIVQVFSKVYKVSHTSKFNFTMDQQ